MTRSSPSVTLPSSQPAGPATRPVDPGLDALVLLLAYHGVTTSAALLRRERQRPDAPFDAPALVQAVQAVQGQGLKAGMSATSWNRLARVSLPAIAEMRSGDFVLLAKVGGDEALVHDPLRGRPVVLPRKLFEDAWSGRLIVVKPPRRARRLVSNHERPFGFAWFLPLLGQHKALLAQAVVATLLLQMFGLAMPLATTIVMDKVLVTGGVTTLDIIAFGLLVSAVFEFGMAAVRTLLFSHVTNRLDTELSATLFRHLSALPIGYFDSRQTGTTTARMQDLEAIRGFLAGAALTSIIDLAFTVIFLGVMALYSLFLTAIVAACMLAVVVTYGVITPRLRARLMRRARGGADSQSFLIETVTGIETVKSLALETQMQSRWNSLVGEHVVTARQVDRLSQTTGTTVALINRLMTVATLWWGAHLVIAGAMSAGQLMGFNMMAGRVMAPAQRLAQMGQQFQQARLAVRRVGEVLNARSEPVRASAAALPALRGRVTFRNVGFRYQPKEPEVLRKVSFDIQPGEVVGIVGSSGSGKSTLARLILRLYLPDSGKVLIDGADVAGVDPQWLRRQVALLPQDTFLFDRSVRENIAVADPSLSLEAVAQAARLAGAHDFIMDLPGAYDARVGERGHRLSGGQRQRIALARTLATDPRVLILDEATSALDVESERVIHDNMRQICARRTVLIIAHRLSAVRLADRILVLEHGELVEQGTPVELLQAGGRFAALWRHQAGPNDDERGFNAGALSGDGRAAAGGGHG